MAYRKDPDLEFLSELSSEELHNLVEILTLDKEGKALLTENLTYSEKYKKHYPDHKMYWEEIAEELQLFGGNTFMNLIKGNKGVLYREILCDVCDRLKVNYNKKSAVTLIEQHLLMKILSDALEKMSPEEIKQLADELGINSQKMISSPQGLLGVFLAIYKAGGVQSYKLTLMISNLILSAFGKKLPPVMFNAGFVAMPKPLIGPIGLISGILLAIDIAGAAYRVTIPAVIQVAYLRSLFVNRDEINQFKKKIDEVIEPIKQADYAKDISYDRVANFIKNTADWDNAKKIAFIEKVRLERTGMAGWDYIGPDSPEVIFELATSENLRNIYEAAIAIYPECDEAKELQRILDLARYRMERMANHIYKQHSNPSVKFKDFGLKLAVVNELMFNQEKLTPKFERKAFLLEQQKCINMETNDFIKYIQFNNPLQGSFFPFPILNESRPYYTYTALEIIKYFEYLDIPSEMLLAVEKLGIKRETPLHCEMLRYFRNAGKMKIDDDTLSDLHLLPNLKAIHIDKPISHQENKNNCESIREEKISYPENLAQILEQKGISLILED